MLRIIPFLKISYRKLINAIYSGNQKMLKAERVQEMMKNHDHRYHDDQIILKNQDEKYAKEKPGMKNLNDDQDLKERIDRKLFETNISNSDFVFYQ